MGVIPLSILKFIIVGFANTSVGLGVIWLASSFGANTVMANVSGYTFGVTLSFLLNKQWTFAFRGESGGALLRFLAVFAVAYLANLGTVLSLTGVTRLDRFWCQAIGTIPYSTLFYLGSRWYAFPSR